MGGNSENTITKAFNEAISANLRGRNIYIDVEAYQHILDGSGLTGGQKQQVLESIWYCMVCFVDAGFAVQPLEPACGQLQTSRDEGDKNSSNALHCAGNHKDEDTNNAPEAG
ncbi:hypothetical protein [Phaeobacter inhibens]|uniref:hypothetical protein n=1 Tax=Phaeobacter inhibens TaxID=221822 RepID=UPI00076BBE7E|nr:hypothetical protein [Phaeobacter inhibens]KXF90541.1 hypothetical protein AT574_10295 [Phaeobacter inhibens]WHP69598.1 hypothetical protein QMZ01_05285 [Phaeobacter inhibens]